MRVSSRGDERAVASYGVGRNVRYCRADGAGKPLDSTPPRERPPHPATSPTALFEAALQPGDVALVKGTSCFSGAVRYLTQSTWSHAGLYVGNCIDPVGFVGERRTLVEADVSRGGCAGSVSPGTPAIIRASAGPSACTSAISTPCASS